MYLFDKKSEMVVIDLITNYYSINQYKIKRWGYCR